MGNGKWGLGIGNWELGSGEWGIGIASYFGISEFLFGFPHSC